MPAYDFKCPKCGQEQQLICSIKDYDVKKSEIVCNNCGSKLERIISSVGSTFIVKCNGFFGKSN